MAKYEHELTAFAALGLDDVEMDAALTYLLSFVQASARSAAEAAAIQRDSAMSDEQWWAMNAPFLTRVFDRPSTPPPPESAPPQARLTVAPAAPHTPTNSGFNASSTASASSSKTTASSPSP
jgi:hypothetical protein